MINHFQNGNFILCWASIEYFNDFYLHLLVLGWCNTTCSLSEKLQLIHSTHTWMLRLLPPDRSLGAKEFQSNCLKSVIKSSWLRVPHCLAGLTTDNLTIPLAGAGAKWLLPSCSASAGYWEYFIRLWWRLTAHSSGIQHTHWRSSTSSTRQLHPLANLAILISSHLLSST